MAPFSLGRVPAWLGAVGDEGGVVAALEVNKKELVDPALQDLGDIDFVWVQKPLHLQSVLKRRQFVRHIIDVDIRT